MPLTRDASLSLNVSELSGQGSMNSSSRKSVNLEWMHWRTNAINEFRDLKTATLRLTRLKRRRAHDVKQQGFLSVQAVLGLVKNLRFNMQRGFLDDFLAVMRGQAVQENSVTGR